MMRNGTTSNRMIEKKMTGGDADGQPLAAGGPAPPTWPDALAASLETINAIAHEFAHDRP
jgi:hypothetical protein